METLDNRFDWIAFISRMFRRLFAGKLCPIALAVFLAMLCVPTGRAFASQNAACQPPFLPPAALRARLVAICGVHAPEDLEALPGGRYIIASETRGLEDVPGHLGLINLATDDVEILPRPRDGGPDWGDPSCTDRGENAPFAPHGIHLSTRSDGKLELLVIDHAQREAIEFYEIRSIPGGYEAAWRGCVENHGLGLFNDLAADGHGGFVATVSFDKTALLGKTGQFALSNINNVLNPRKNTGYLLSWSPGTKLRKLPDSEAPFNNGIQFSADGKQIYFAAWTAKQLRVYDLKTQKTVKIIPVSFLPDNISIGPDGHYLVAGITSTALWSACFIKHVSFCSSAFKVISWDPLTGVIRQLFDGPPGIMAGASVGVQVGDAVYVGSYSGERVLKILLPN